MRHVRDTLICISLALVVLVLWQAFHVLKSVESTISALPATLDNAVAREATATREALVYEIRSLRTDGRQIAENLNRTVIAFSTDTREQLLVRLDEIAGTLTEQTGATGGAVRALLSRYERIPDEAAWATRQIWDCEGNPDCLENRYVSASRAIESASRAVQSGLPRITVSLERSSAATASATEQTNLLVHDARAWLTPPPKWARSPWIQTPIYIGSRIILPFRFLIF